MSGKGTGKQDKGTDRDEIKKRDQGEHRQDGRRSIKDHGHVRDRVPDPDSPPKDDE